MKPHNILIILFINILFICSCSNNNSNLGIFDFSNDIGNVALKGNAVFNKKDSSYILNGSGENMWFEKDEYHYVYKSFSGDFSFSTNLDWIGKGENAHRKAGIIIRQDLTPGSPYIDAVIHGDGLTSIQYREIPNCITYEVRSNVKMPKRINLQKEGEFFYLSTANENEDIKFAGNSVKLKISNPFFIGIGVCSHDNNVIESAEFSNLSLKKKSKMKEENSNLQSTLEIVNIETKNRKIIYSTNKHIEAPNWSGDDSFFIYNSEGLLFKIPLEGGTPEKINTHLSTKCNNDHGLSPDNKQIVISDQSSIDGKSRIYILPVEGGIPKLITKNGPSYWHGWSPDGNTLAYCAERDGLFDIYTISVNGGTEKRLTNAEGLDDGPDYSPDGKYIYFNSIRTGKMEIWRMNADGSDQIQITDDEYNNWFPHPSPDGKWLVFLTYDKDVVGHPANKDVMIRIMSIETGEIDVLVKLFGGQGTINVPSWSPDSKNVAFVSYRLY
ncbi:MAG: PD40 domain-containing protein [Ignavibacteriales bacterium]|nr:PD40 domain-containing protein [Ignavibacteriales bacterium]